MKRRRGEEGGFALLMIFVMAAAVAITLYMEMPRVAFESQRVKEQLLIDRGEQYKRAIQLFVRKTKRFPTTMDELEKFQEVRFLRHRYKDPMTGKDEWRVIHVNGAGALTDSLVQKQTLGPNGQPVDPNNPNAQASGGPQGPGQSLSANPGFSSAGPGAGQPGQPGQPPDPVTGLNMAVARRPSDRSPTAGPGQPGQPALDANGQPIPPDPSQQQQTPQPQYPGQQPQYPGQPPQYPGLQPGQVQTPPVYPGQPGQPGQPVIPGQPGQVPQYPGMQPALPGQPGYIPGLPNGIPQAFRPNPNQPYNPNQAYNPNQPYNPAQQYNPNTNPNPNPQYQASQPPAGTGFSFGNNNNAQNPGAQNPAINAIQNAIFSPRQPPGGVGSSFGTGSAGGIAGVATTYKGPSIKVVNERQKYQEWEFVYDMKKDKSLMGNQGQAGQMPGQQPGQQPQNPGFGSSSGNTSSFGSGSTSSGFGTGTSGFGSQPAPQPQPQQQQPQP